MTGSKTLLVGRDLRSSSPRIAGDCMAAANARGWRAVDCGALPTPALALAALRHPAPAVMVTGSHIPDDRNGLKFYSPAGEITKADEAGIWKAHEAIGVLPAEGNASDIEDAAEVTLESYRRRYTDFFPADALSGVTVGVYQQSSVARDLLADVLRALGAEVVPLGRAERFIPVDTEAYRPEDLKLLGDWAAGGDFDAIVSTDGDADRPLVADAEGEALRGDLLGLLAAQHLGLATIITPVTSSALVDTSGVARKVCRTKVGSPFVIAGMEEAVATGYTDVIGFEANGGVLLGSPVGRAGRKLASLPTRDAILPIICVLAGARTNSLTIRQLAGRLGASHAFADRLKDVPAEKSGAFLHRLGEASFADEFFREVGSISSNDKLDGTRFVLDDGSVVHFRASGNAPEFRCYVESTSETRARQLIAWGLTKAKLELAAAL